MGYTPAKNLDPNWAKIVHLPQIKIFGDISLILFSLPINPNHVTKF